MATPVPGGVLAVLAAVLTMGMPVRSAETCPPLQAGTPWVLSPVLQPAAEPPADPAGDYRHRLKTTPLGWPLERLWCVWVEPPDPVDPALPTSKRWHQAVGAALQEWQQLLPIELVEDPLRAQVTVWRRRPPLGEGADGRPRASHGRALLSLHTVGEGSTATVKPRVEVWISPGQRQEAIQATALHELGHAFGVWGHSEDPQDAMAVSPGAQPVLRLTARDRATVQWLYRQPGRLPSKP